LNNFSKLGRLSTVQFRGRFLYLTAFGLARPLVVVSLFSTLIEPVNLCQRAALHGSNTRGGAGAESGDASGGRVAVLWEVNKTMDAKTAEQAMHDTAFSPGPLSRFLSDDHERLDRLLQHAVADPAKIDDAAYTEFRAGLLKHIGMEEKILLPAARAARGGEPLPMAARLRLDHGAIAALLVPSPTPKIVAALRAILSAHNAIEEGAGGLYDVCERLAGAQVGAWVARLRNAPEVPVAPYNNGPRVLPAARRALERAGYRIDLGEER
jgi:hypothetical protein